VVINIVQLLGNTNSKDGNKHLGLGRRQTVQPLLLVPAGDWETQRSGSKREKYPGRLLYYTNAVTAHMYAVSSQCIHIKGKCDKCWTSLY